MSSFNDAVIEVLKREGGYSDDVGDPGGATDFGISLRFLKEQGIDINHDGHFDIEDIKSLTEDTAKAIYKKCWWDKYKYYWVNNQELALKIFDFSVNAGPRASHQTAQRAINSLIDKPIAVDGVLGAQSCHYLNTLNQDKLLDAYKHYQKIFYQDLVNKHPALKKFLKGWLNRAEM
jgi:lysozyme family protein